ncbi:MAG: hypothetical protein FWC16_11505 [Defluviitaleaceae bacterium]|nr:hypothetical protein [Defluviitaleaceae bacterium]MCL2275545.1 hypothetical protein [Defluviitaleaceae bacterium]
MKRQQRLVELVDRAVNIFELIIAVLLLVVVAIKLYDAVAHFVGVREILYHMPFERILSTAFSLVIGVEFVRMLCKHTPETVIDVLLFATARQTILYHEGGVSKLVGVVAIAGLFAVRRFLIDRKTPAPAMQETQ